MTPPRSQPIIEVTEDQKALCHDMNVLLLIEHGLDEAMAARVAERFRDKCSQLASARKALEEISRDSGYAATLARATLKEIAP